MASKDDSVIYNFQSQQDATDWYVVNDGVMGGFSKGKISLSNEGNGLFEGTITTENNGGFSSLKHAFSKKEVSHFKSVKLHLKGDGKLYQFRIKPNESQQHSYISEFTTMGEWETITIPFKIFYPSFRGNTLDLSNYDGQFMEEITFLIGNKKKESFALEIERIWLEK